MESRGYYKSDRHDTYDSYGENNYSYNAESRGHLSFQSLRNPPMPSPRPSRIDDREYRPHTRNRYDHHSSRLMHDPYYRIEDTNQNRDADWGNMSYDNRHFNHDSFHFDRGCETVPSMVLYNFESPRRVEEFDPGFDHGYAYDERKYRHLHHGNEGALRINNADRYQDQLKRPPLDLHDSFTEIERRSQHNERQRREAYSRLPAKEGVVRINDTDHCHDQILKRLPVEPHDSLTEIERRSQHVERQRREANSRLHSQESVARINYTDHYHDQILKRPPPEMQDSLTEIERRSQHVEQQRRETESHVHAKKPGPPLIEIEPGWFAHLRGATETFDAVKCDFFVPTECYCCSSTVFCIQDADFILCPTCRVVSQISVENGGGSEQNGGTGGGVGLGFTIDDLASWQDDIQRERDDAIRLRETQEKRRLFEKQEKELADMKRMAYGIGPDYWR